MAEAHQSHTKEYLYVFALLTILTVVELFVPSLETTYALKASALTLLAIAKAFAVAYYFMHLKSETRWLKFVAIGVPVSAALYPFVIVILDSIYR